MNPNEAVCLFLSAIKVIFLAPFENFCSISTKMKYSIGIKSAFCSQIRYIHVSKVRQKSNFRRRRFLTNATKSLVSLFSWYFVAWKTKKAPCYCLHHLHVFSCRMTGWRTAGGPFRLLFFLPFPGPHSRHFILFPIPEWTQLPWLSLRPQAKPGLYKL